MASRDSWWLGVLMALALLTRFAMLTHPRQVVFDEYHFGSFAGQSGRLDGATAGRHGLLRLHRKA